MPPLRLTLPLALAASSLAATAQDAPRRGPPLWEVGGLAVGVSQQAYPGADEQLDRVRALPFVIYRGKVVRADGDTAGLRALKTDRVELDLGVSGAFGGGNSEIRAREGMRELGTLVELGPRLKIRLGDTAAPASEGRWRLDLPLRGVFDLSDSGRHRGMAFEPQIVFDRQARGGWRYSTSLGAIVADRRLGEHFYGVSSAEARLGRPAYLAKSGLVAWRVSASASYSLSRDWRLFGFARLDTVAGAANEDSPLVRDRTGASVGIGVSYTWKRSEASAHD